ncbi:alpha/beta hydrolase family protein [Nocardia sp. NPDC050712]|uniref:alpha/beta hydrolase n=1 Tax=Nocardia sp. NPDC050712 TaxID=3155518 RepID=UPI0033FC56C4
MPQPHCLVSLRTAISAVWAHRRTAAVLLTVVAAFTVGAVLPSAVAEPSHRHGEFEELLVPSRMGPVKVQVQWADGDGAAALYLLDGLRALPSGNGWAVHTDATELFGHDNVTLVMPVGGESSWYADWSSRSSLNGQAVPYRWETFLTTELPDFLARYGIDRTRTAVAGLSMGASAALALAANHRDQFVHATALSGLLDWSLPWVREAMRLAALQGGGYDLTALAPPDSPRWQRLDPAALAPALAGLPMYISAASGIPGPADSLDNPEAAAATIAGIGLEAGALISTRSFEQRLRALNIAVVVDYPATGTHSWPYWGSQLAAARPQILAALGVE